MEKPDVNRHEYVCGLCPLDSNIHTVSESSPNLIARFCDFKGNSIEQNQFLHRSVSVDWSCPAACHRHCDKTTLLQDIPCATSGWWCLPMGCCPRSAEGVREDGTFLSLRNSDTRLVPRVWIGSLGICFYLGSCRVPELWPARAVTSASARYID